MSTPLPPSEEELFSRALELPAAERGAYLDHACAGDARRRARIETLLRADAVAHGFLESPPAAERLHGPAKEATDVSVAGVGDRIGRYKLLQKIGEGGCGVVFMAEQEEPVRRRVALKVIKLGMDTREVIARFEAERQALALMDHPNIARVFDGGATAAGRPYFVMELVRGTAITRFCDDHNLPTATRLDLFTQICHAVQHAHQKGVIHRDIKPSNLLVTVNDGRLVPKVIDFGIAKATQGRLTDHTLFTAFEQFIGTPAYMSPEQAEMTSLDVDTRSDIYSLGVLLYELLTGRPPFDPRTLGAAGLDEIRRIIREVEPPPPSTRLSTLSEQDRATIARQRGIPPSELSTLLRDDLDWIVMCCLEKDRTRRYETADRLAQDIACHLRHEPVTARPPSPVYVLQKFVRRHRFGFLSAGAIAVTLILGGLVSTSQAIRAHRAERLQIRLREAAQTAQARAEAEALRSRQRAYASDLNLAQRALASDNLGRAQALLNRHRPAGTERDLRGWEWRYLWQLCRGEAEASLGHKDHEINALAVSPDGHWLAIAEAGGGGLSLLNLRTQAETRVPAGDWSVRVAFSPRDPLIAIGLVEKAATSDPLHLVRLWNTQSREVVATLPLNGICTGLFFSGDGQTLLTSATGPANEISLWRVADGTRLSRIPAPALSEFHWSPFAVMRDLSFAVYTSAFGRISVLDLATGRERWSAQAADESVLSIAVSPDGKTVATGAGFVEPAIRLWDAGSGRELARLEGHRTFVGALVFWPDGSTLASASGDQTIRLWNVASRQPLRTLRAHKSEVWSLALFPDSATLVSGGKDGMVYLCDTTRQPPAGAGLTLPAPVAKWRFAEAGQALVTLNPDGDLVQWRGPDLRRARLLMNLGRFTPRALWMLTNATCMAADSPLIAVGSRGGRVRVWNWETRTQVHEIETNAPAVFPRAFLAGGTKLLVATGNDDFSSLALQRWDLPSGNVERTWAGPDGASRFFLGISRDAHRGALVGYERGLSLINLSTGHQTMPAAAIGQGQAPAFSPDGTLLAIPSSRGLIHLWETSPAREVATLSGFMQGVHSVAFSPDGRRLATGSSGIEAIRLWDLESLEALLTLPGQGSIFHHGEFSADGALLGAQNLAGMLHLWRAPSWSEIEAEEKARRTP